MGNSCCPNKEQSNIGQKPKKVEQMNATPFVHQQFEGQLFGITILVKQGDLSKEQADAIIIGTDNFVKNRSNSFISPVDAAKIDAEIAQKRGVNEEPLRSGNIILTGSGGLKNTQNLVHIAIPVWRGGIHKEVLILEEGFKNALNEITKENLSSVICTDIGSQLFGIPKQHTAAALLNAIKYYGQSCQQSNKIKTLLFVHNEQETIKIFEDCLKEEMGLKFDRVQSDYSDHLQGSQIGDFGFIEPTHNDKVLKESLLSDQDGCNQIENHPSINNASQ